MILKGTKVTLRPLIESDFDYYFKWHLDNEIRFQTLMHPYPVTERQEKAWFEKVITDITNKRLIFSVICEENQEIVGYFQLTEINFINRNAKLGIVIAEKNYQGKGLGKEIMQLGLDYGFKYLGLYKISLEVLATNEKAIKLYKKMGFIDEGTFKSHFYFEGQWHDILCMALFNKD